MSRSINYASVDNDVRILLDKVTDTVINDTKVQYLMDIADNYIDSRLAYMYTVPFTSTPPIITTISAHLTAYFTLRWINAKTVASPEGSWISVYKDFADTLLNNIIDGSLTLVNSSGTDISRKSDYGIKISTEDYTPIFNEGEPRDWEIDQDKIDDQIEGR